MNYQEAMEYMEKVGTYGIVPGLDSIRELCRRLGNPQDELKFVHIAGTNGKGSTLAYISSILQAAGYRVGKYISPVIIEYCEKIQIGKQKITHKDLCEGLEIIKKHCDAMVSDGFHHPTPFEIETALAFWYFREKQCDIVVLETGMGGREDATNLITTTQVAVLASIGMDHMKFLGNSLEEIAAHKTGICKPGWYLAELLKILVLGVDFADDLKQNQHRKRQRGQNQNRGFRPPAVDLPACAPVGRHNVRQGRVEVQVRGKIQHADNG